jgi:hypothetical protein
MALGLGLAGFAAGQTGKSLPNRAGNGKLSLRGTVITDQKEVAGIMGIDLGEGYVLVQIRATPETPEGLFISIDDFTLVSRKDGERGSAMSPNEIAGSGGLILGKAGSSGGGIGTRQPGGLGGQIPGLGGQIPGAGGGGVGNSGSTEGGLADVRQAPRGRGEDPRMAPLDAKIFKDGETTQPVEGLLYFYMEKKVKPKDLGLIYAGQAGRLIIDFQ